MINFDILSQVGQVVQYSPMRKLELKAFDMQATCFSIIQHVAPRVYTLILKSLRSLRLMQQV